MTLEVNEALARMSTTSLQNVTRVLTFPDVQDLSQIPDSVPKLEPYIGDVPVAGTWMGGAVIVPTPLDLSSKLEVDLMHNLTFREADWNVPELGTIPAVA